MAVTENFGWPLPDETATVREEMERLRDQTLPAIDADVHALEVEVAGKADDEHSHTIGDVTGLTTALAEKMPANTTFALDDLDDVVGADAAPDGYVLVKVGDQWVAQAAAAAIGDHDHGIDDVVGLEDALEARYSKTETDERLADKLNKTGSNVGDATAQAAFRTAIGAAPAANSLRDDTDQAAQSKSAAFKVNILKNTLQAWELVPGGVVDVSVAVPQVDWSALDVYRMLRLKGIFVPATSDTALRWRTGSGSFDTSANYFSHYVQGDSSVVNAAPPAGDTSCSLNAPVGTVNGLYHGTINANFYEFNKARVLKYDQFSGSLSNVGPAWKTIILTGGFSSNTAGRDRLRLFAASGNIAAGSYFVLEGLRG